MAVALKREQLLNDFTNTGIVGALIGGFALSDFSSITDVSTGVASTRCVLMFLAVHLSTASAVSASLCYRAVNALDEDQAVAWSLERAKLRMVVFANFCIGAVLYVAGVVFAGLSTFSSARWQILFCTAGALCCMMLAGVAVLAQKPPQKGRANSV